MIASPKRLRARYRRLEPIPPPVKPKLAGLPSFSGSALPATEPFRQTLLIRVVAVVALLIGLAYLWWRATQTVDLAVWWVSLPLLLFEIHAFIGLALCAFSLWDIHALPPAPRVETATDPATSPDIARLAVLIPTDDETREILLPTIAAAVALRPNHETWVLDDGDRSWVAQLAAELGARYLACPERTDAKADIINHALGAIDADFVAILNADQVAAPNLLRHTLGYFDDPRVAIVQTPRDFYNQDSFEHDTRGRGNAGRRAPHHEQTLFYRLVQPGKNRWGVALWCGTSAIARVSALRAIGGIATATIAEDLHTTIKLHRRGWKTVYHNEVLARGRAASDAARYQVQRFRWGIGAMQVLRVENPLTCSGLRLGQRLAYAATMLGYFDSWRWLGYLLLPPIVLLTGAAPIHADAPTFLIAFSATFALRQLSMALLGRGYYRPILGTMFELVRMTPHLLATLTLPRPASQRFQVTPRGHEGDGRQRIPAPRLLTGIVGVSFAVALWFALTLAGYTPLRYASSWVTYGAAFLLLVNMAFLIYAIARVRSPRYGVERRRSVRFPTALTGRFDEIICEIRDLSLTGALITLPEAAAQRVVSTTDETAHLLTIQVGDTRIRLHAIVRSRRGLSFGLAQYGVQFQPDQSIQQARLALALFNAQLVPEIETGAETWTVMRGAGD